MNEDDNVIRVDIGDMYGVPEILAIEERDNGVIHFGPPDDVFLTVDQALRFAEALKTVATEARNNTRGGA